MISAVLFDFGGVILSSPFEAFRSYEARAGLPVDIIRTINSTDPDTNAWARLERSEIDVATFVTAFEAEAAALGHRSTVPRSSVACAASCDPRWSRRCVAARSTSRSRC